MKCNYCGCEENKVVDSRESQDKKSVRRRRECLKCGRRFTTYETMEELTIMVVNKNGYHEPFSDKKLSGSIFSALEKREISQGRKNELVYDVTRAITDLGKREISTKEIAQIVLKELKALDKVAYIRYSLVVHNFSVEEIKSFVSSVK